MHSSTSATDLLKLNDSPAGALASEGYKVKARKGRGSVSSSTTARNLEILATAQEQRHKRGTSLVDDAKDLLLNGGEMVPINKTTGTTPTKEVARNVAGMLKRNFFVSTFMDTADHLQKQCGSNHTFTISDSSRRLVFVSDAFCTMTGYTKDECLNRNCSFLQGAETNRQTVDMMRSELIKGNGCDVEILNYKKDGTPFTNFLVIEPVKAFSGTVLYYVGVQLDVAAATDETKFSGDEVSALKKAEQLALEMEKELTKWEEQVRRLQVQ
jgi:PAS domain S-box-containing protein